VSIDLLDALGDEERANLLRVARRRRFGRGEVVFHEGDPGDSLHVVTRGIFIARSSSILGHSITVNVFGEGGVFGEGVLVTEGSRRSATISALHPGETLMITRAEFEALRRRDPRVDRFLVSVLAERNRVLTAQVVELLYCPAETRVYRRLLSFAELAGSEAGGGWIRLGQSDLATLAGTTRPTTNRALRRAEQRGLIELARGGVRILDEAGLHAAADHGRHR
jgi:CRP/FNR family transcriptional regulator, cyclic AMP receptor protein